jgi:hypothetical protein
VSAICVVLFAWLTGIFIGFIFCYADTKARARDVGGSVRIVPMFAHFDCWIGIYWDRKNMIWYLFPLPMIGMRMFVKEASSDSK